MRSTVLEVHDLVKHYGAVSAVDGISFAIEAGECFGLLGPNGAGKTTAVEIMEGIRTPSSGEVLYKGRPLARRFRAEMGIQFQSTALPEHLNVREVLTLFRALYRKTLSLSHLARVCSLEDFMDRDTRTLSGGQMQRVLLALALVNDPEILFLDEPTTGLDPQARRNFWSLVDAIKAGGKTLLLTTHYMEEAYMLCDRVAIMDRGRIIAEGSPKDLLKTHFEGVRIVIPAEDIPFDPKDLRWPFYLTRHGVEIQTNDVDETIRYLLDRGVGFGRAEIRSQTLEDLFLELTGRELRA